MKRKLLFRGTGTALVTPFTSKGGVDESALRKLVEFVPAKCLADSDDPWIILRS